jgi:hypothetical protein
MDFAFGYSSQAVILSDVIDHQLQPAMDEWSSLGCARECGHDVFCFSYPSKLILALGFADLWPLFAAARGQWLVNVGLWQRGDECCVKVGIIRSGVLWLTSFVFLGLGLWGPMGLRIPATS